MKPFISVCVPVYNGERYLQQCLDSLRAQTYRNIEIIISDDFSTDHSLALIEEFSKSDDRVKVIRNQYNIGLVKNWNQCIYHASGEWIKYLFQDDYFEPNCIEKFVEYIEKTDGEIPLLVSKRNFLLNESSDKEYYLEDLPTLDRIGIPIREDRISASDMCNAAVAKMSMNFIGEPTVVMFKRNVTDMIGYYNESLKQLCDLEFMLRIASQYGIVFVPFELTLFRIHKNSETSTNTITKRYEMSNIEPIRLAHLLLFDEDYLEFRNKLTRYHRIKLKTYFYVRGYEAYNKAKMNSDDLVLFNSECERFPMMKSLKKKSFIRQLLYTLILIKRQISSQDQ